MYYKALCFVLVGSLLIAATFAGSKVPLQAQDTVVPNATEDTGLATPDMGGDTQDTVVPDATEDASLATPDMGGDTQDTAVPNATEDPGLATDLAVTADAAATQPVRDVTQTLEALPTNADTPVPTITPIPSPTQSPSPVTTRGPTSITITAGSSYNGIPMWRYDASVTVLNLAGGASPDGQVALHWTDRALVNRSMTCTLSNGACSVSFTDNLIYYIVQATYQGTTYFNSSTSTSVGTGR